jgi:hypothetical protein
MRHYPKYLVKTEDEFNSFNFPQIEQDLSQINEVSINVPQMFKAEILISFTKNHSLKHELITANPLFAGLVTGNILPIANITSLFESSFRNTCFQQQFERYLKESFSK